MNDFKEPAEARLSSTVILLRGNDETEVLMVARSYEIDFASGAFVFPGGKVSEDDRREGWKAHCVGQYEGDELAVRIGGIREVFEESGVLLARRAGDKSGAHVPQSMCSELAVHRHAVDRGEKSFLELVQENDLELCLDDLVPYAHWITPEMMPKRFDTRFFVARAPKEQEAVHDGRETTEAVWVRPGDILQRAKDGTATVIFPTRLNLEMLEDLGSTDNIMNTSATRPVVTVLPVVQKRDDEAFLVIPEEAGYRVSEEAFESIAKATAAKKAN